MIKGLGFVLLVTKILSIRDQLSSSFICAQLKIINGICVVREGLSVLLRIGRSVGDQSRSRVAKQAEVGEVVLDKLLVRVVVPLFR